MDDLPRVRAGAERKEEQQRCLWAKEIVLFSWIWLMGKMFLSPGIGGVLVQKNVELSQVSLDDMSWTADVSV